MDAGIIWGSDDFTFFRGVHYLHDFERVPRLEAVCFLEVARVWDFLERAHEIDDSLRPKKLNYRALGLGKITERVRSRGDEFRVTDERVREALVSLRTRGFIRHTSDVKLPGGNKDSHGVVPGNFPWVTAESGTSAYAAVKVSITAKPSIAINKTAPGEGQAPMDFRRELESIRQTLAILAARDGPNNKSGDGPEDELEQARLVLRADPENTEALLKIASAFRKLGRFERARKTLEKVDEVGLRRRNHAAIEAAAWERLELLDTRLIFQHIRYRKADFNMSDPGLAQAVAAVRLLRGLYPDDERLEKAKIQLEHLVKPDSEKRTTT